MDNVMYVDEWNNVFGLIMKFVFFNCYFFVWVCLYQNMIITKIRVERFKILWQKEERDSTNSVVIIIILIIIIIIHANSMMQCLPYVASLLEKLDSSSSSSFVLFCFYHNDSMVLIGEPYINLFALQPRQTPTLSTTHTQQAYFL